MRVTSCFQTHQTPTSLTFPDGGFLSVSGPDVKL
jgi:hypothetical protein